MGLVWRVLIADQCDTPFEFQYFGFGFVCFLSFQSSCTQGGAIRLLLVPRSIRLFSLRLRSFLFFSSSRLSEEQRRRNRQQNRTGVHSAFGRIAAAAAP